MQGETAFITVDCLRGRLQAERAASRAAEHNVQLLAIKLSELEKQVKIETRFRRKAEKKLNSLKKKLESLNIPMNDIISEKSEGFSSSNNSDISCVSSITSTSFNQQEDHHLPAFRGSKSSSITSEIAEDITGSEIRMEQKRQDECERQELDDNCHGFKQLVLEEKRNDEQLVMEEKINDDEIEENQDNSDVDNSIALVPISFFVEPDNSCNGPLEVKGENVREVLDNLKLIRENLQSSLEGRRVIIVG